MTWDFFDARIDEAYGIVDNKNKWMQDTSPVDVVKFEGYLQKITEGNEPTNPCPIAQGIVGGLNAASKKFNRHSRFKTFRG